MIEVMKYKCEHCGREYKVSKNALGHEKICWKDPNKKSCLTCIHFGGFDYATAWSDYGEERYIVCKTEPDLPDSDKPVLNCEKWVHDTRTKKQKRKAEVSKIVEELNMDNPF